MSFQFKKLTLKDWLVYGGVETVEFDSFQQGKNLVVIHGQNGSGKTSLLRAMQFLFHNDLNRDEWYEVWNDRAKNHEEGSLEVSLEFIHNGSLHKLTRFVEFKPWRSTIAKSHGVELWIDGEQVEDQIEDKIAQIIPNQTQQFVFFDGAEITRYAHKQYTDGVKEAIELVLGIPAVRNLRDDLEKLISDLEDEQTELLAKQGKNEALLAEIDEQQAEIEGYTARRKKLVEQQQSIQHTLDELEQEASQIQLIESEREQLNLKRQRRAMLEDRLIGLDKDIAELLEKAPQYMLAEPLAQIIEEQSARQDRPTRKAAISHQFQYLEDILDQENCVCGRLIDAAAEEALIAEIERLKALIFDSPETREASTTIREIGELSGILNTIRSGTQNGHKLFDDRAAAEVSLEEVETEIRRLEEKLEQHSAVEVQELFRQKATLEEQLVDTKADLQSLDANITRAQNKLRELSRERDQLATTTEQGHQLTRTLETTRRVHSAIDEYVEQLVFEKRQDIETLTSRIFASITNKPLEYDGVQVNNDYTLTVYRRDGSLVENEKLSAGEKEVLAYSFITALNLSSLNPAPFVMDTPFGHLDSGHREGLLKSLPRLPVQVFLLATDRDLPPDERDKVQSAIAQEFEIRRDQRDVVSYIEEVE